MIVSHKWWECLFLLRTEYSYDKNVCECQMAMNFQTLLKGKLVYGYSLLGNNRVYKRTVRTGGTVIRGFATTVCEQLLVFYRIVTSSFLHSFVCPSFCIVFTNRYLLFIIPSSREFNRVSRPDFSLLDNLDWLPNLHVLQIISLIFLLKSDKRLILKFWIWLHSPLLREHLIK